MRQEKDTGITEEKDGQRQETATQDGGEQGQEAGMKPTAAQMLRDLASDEDDAQTRTPITLGMLLGGDLLVKGWFRKNFLYIVMLIGMVIVYVGNRYSCQQEMIKTKALSDTLLDRRYKALTRRSQLKERTRRSVIEESLADTALQTSVTPSYNLKVSEE